MDMGKPLINLVGSRFGRLVVSDRAPNKSARDTNARWNCICDCGNETIAYGQDLRRGKQRSCGCYDAEQKLKHGMSAQPEYRAWLAMLDRCGNQQNKAWKNYGGRGISVCDRWKSFESFFADMGKRPSAKHSIDRIKNEGNYEPSNCHWATNREQLNNRRGNRHIEWQGKTKTIAEWAVFLGIKDNVLRQRLDDYGWPVNRAFTEPVKQAFVFHYKGKSQTLKEWSGDSGIGFETLRARVMKLGWGFEEAISVPVKRKKQSNPA